MSHESLSGRAVLVTGGARGLGRSVALALAGAGARVCVTGSRPSAELAEMSEALRAAGAADALALVADVTDAAACQRAAQSTEAAFGRIDVLVNNAGRGMRLVSERFTTEPTRFWETPPEAWARIVETNATGPFLMARAVVPGMVARGFGKVINVSTSAQTMVRRGYAPYGPSKAFLEAASRVWAQDLEGTGVEVTVLLPGGATDTDLLPGGPNRRGADGNLLPVTVMDEAALWLASDLSTGANGARIIGRLWDPADPSAARDDGGAPPRLL